jgi:nucleotide-binding universal stress UspA family protein
MKISIKKILCPVDFSESSDHALQYALALAEAYGAELRLLHVVEVPASAVAGGPVGAPVLSIDNLEAFQKSCGEHLARVAGKASEQYGNVTYHLSSGVPFLGIIQSAKAENVDLIVAGTHGRTGLAHALIGSVAEKLVRKAPCPVLTVKHPEREFVMP